MDGQRCECSCALALVTGQRIYPHREDLHHLRFWECPSCGRYVGCHPGTTKPLGRPADEETRRARSAAHAAFDPLWRRGGMTRREAYRWLADAMGKPVVHIGDMTAVEARRVVEIVKATEV